MLENMSTPTADSNRLDQFLNFYISDKLRDIVKLTNVVRNWQDEIIPIGNFHYSKSMVLNILLSRQQELEKEGASSQEGTSDPNATQVFSAFQSDNLAAVDNKIIEALLPVTDESWPCHLYHFLRQAVWKLPSVRAELSKCSDNELTIEQWKYPRKAAEFEVAQLLEDNARTITSKNQFKVQAEHPDAMSVNVRTKKTSEWIVLLLNAAALPEACRRSDSLADRGTYEILWLVSSNNDDGVIFETEVVLVLSFTKDKLSMITCKLYDTGDVIRDYLQEKNELPIEAELCVSALICHNYLQFENFQLKREKKTYCFESAPCEVSDRFAIEFLTSTSLDLDKVTIRVMDAGTPDKLSYSAATCVSLEGHSVIKKVFDNDLLLDKIVGYVVQDEDVERSERPKYVVAVSRAWRESVRRVLKSKHAHFLTPCSIARKHKLTPGGYPLGTVLPYNLVVVEDYHVTPEVVKFVKTYSPIGLRYVYCGMPDEELYDMLRIASLESLEFSSPDEDIQVEDLQHVLDPYVNLKRLTIIGHLNESLPNEKLMLPKALRSLYLRTNATFISSLKCNEDRLSELRLFDVRINKSMPEHANGGIPPEVQEQLSINLNRLLRKMALLEYLLIEVDEAEESQIAIPGYLNLIKLVFEGTRIFLESSTPKLENLCLRGIALESFLGLFAKGQKYVTISKLEFNCNELTPDAIDKMAIGFPSCVDLNLQLLVDSDISLIFSRLFAGMQRLTSLRISFVVEDEAFLTEDYLVSYLTGLNLGEVRRMRGPEQEYDSIDSQGSGINNLMNLRNLALHVKTETGLFLQMPDLLFRLYIMEMPALKNIDLEAGLTVADDVIDVWRNNGGLFVNRSSEDTDSSDSE